MNAILIYPEFPDTFWSFKHALRFVRKRASYPPLGLLTVAAMLPVDWTLRLVDLNVRALTAEDLADADIAFISAMTVQRESTVGVIAQCHAAGVTIVAGGPLFAAEPGNFDRVAHLVLNEAEVTLPEFLADFERGCARHVYTTTEFADIETTPVPRWDLIDMNHYASMCLQFSRGCPFNCDFCNVTALFGHRPRTKRADQIIAELDSLHAAGWRRGVFFVDDNLIGNRKRLRNELLPALIAWRRGRKGFPFSTEASINLADDPALMEMMVEAGFNAVFIGIETPEADSLAECSKKQNLNRDLLADVRRINRCGLQVQGGFIVGFDSDTPQTFQRLIDFIQSSGIVTAMVGLLQAPPGTRLHTRMAEAGRLRGVMSGDNVDGTTNIVPVMDGEVLRSGYRRMVRHLYSPQAFYQRARTFLRDYEPPAIAIPWTLPYLRERTMALVKSTYRLGVVDRGRRQYWTFFFWALRRKPAVFSMAITFAIYGYHFRRICQLRMPEPSSNGHAM